MLKRGCPFRFIAIMIVIFISVPNTAWSSGKSQKAIINIKTTSVSIHAGEVYNVANIVTITPKTTVKYSSSQPKVASIEAKGVAKGLSIGKTIITVTVTQKGYTGKGDFILQVIAPPVNDKPVTYNDLTLLDNDIRQGLQMLYKKDYNNLTQQEKAAQKKLLNIERKQFIKGLHTIVIKGQPTWSLSWVQHFEANNLEENIPEIAELFTNSTTDAATRAAVEMLKAFKSPKAVVTLGQILNSTSDSNLRFSLSYILSQFKNNPDALEALAIRLVKENDDKVFSNAAYSALTLAGTNQDQIHVLLLNYSKMNQHNREMFVSCLYSYDFDAQYLAIYKAWIPVIQLAQQSSDLIEQEVANEIWNVVKTHKPYNE